MVNRKMMSVLLAVTVIVALLLLPLVIKSKKSVTATSNVNIKIIDTKSTEDQWSAATNKRVELTKIPLDLNSEEVAEYVRIAYATDCSTNINPDDIVVDSVEIQGENVIVTLVHRSLASLKKETKPVVGTRYPKGEEEVMSKGATIWGAIITIDIKTKTVLRIDQG